MKKQLVTFILLLTGCNSFALDEKWRPLEEIVERPVYGSGDGTTTTIGTRIYRPNLDEYLEVNPPGSPKFDSLLYHEQIHSIRQIRTGLTLWLASYANDIDFMWREEQLGWYAELKNLSRRGLIINADAVARSLRQYRNIQGNMVSYDDALRWVNDVLAERWQPADEDRWSLPEWLQNN